MSTVTLKEILKDWAKGKIRDMLPARHVEYTLRLTPDAEKFMELLQLPYDERRRRALDYMGEDEIITMMFGDYKGHGLTLQGVHDPAGNLVKGVSHIEWGKDHVEKLCKLAFPYSEWSKKQQADWEEAKASGKVTVRGPEEDVFT